MAWRRLLLAPTSRARPGRAGPGPSDPDRAARTRGSRRVARDGVRRHGGRAGPDAVEPRAPRAAGGRPRPGPRGGRSLRRRVLVELRLVVDRPALVQLGVVVEVEPRVLGRALPVRTRRRPVGRRRRADGMCCSGFELRRPDRREPPALLTRPSRRELPGQLPVRLGAGMGRGVAQDAPAVAGAPRRTGCSCGWAARAPAGRSASRRRPAPPCAWFVRPSNIVGRMPRTTSARLVSRRTSSIDDSSWPDAAMGERLALHRDHDLARPRSAR